jgi:hypothetical protein
MKRFEFIKISAGLTLLNVSSSLLLPAQLLAEANSVSREKLIMPEVDRESIIISLDSNSWIPWLATLAARSLITTLAAKVVQRYTSDCICDGTTCKYSPSNYRNADGIYAYDNGKRFVKQEVNDQTVGFQNVSVPFLTPYNQHIGNVEGPFLAGMCWAAENISQKSSTTNARKALIPKGGIKNGGYRFDTESCHPTTYKTDYGSTEIAYTPTGSSTGAVKVTIRDEYDNLDWNKTFDFNYA